MKKQILKILCLIISIIYLVFSPIVFYDKLSSKGLLLINNDRNSDYKILEIWNVDTFEGGSVSRHQFLEKRAIEFEKNNVGNFLIIKNYTVQEALNKIDDGYYPSMFSYGTGFGKYIKNFALPLFDSYKVRNDLLEYGKINNTILGIPYILGSYCLIGQNILEQEILSKKILTFESEFVNPLTILSMNNLTNFEQKQLSSFDLYNEYINQKCELILGTQRDVYRCLNRNKNGTLISNFNYLEGYSDLVQYLSILDKNNFDILNKFATFLLSEDCQKKLCNINMFNVLGKNYYEDKVYIDIETILNKNLKSKNAFL